MRVARERAVGPCGQKHRVSGKGLWAVRDAVDCWGPMVGRIQQLQAASVAFAPEVVRSLLQASSGRGNFSPIPSITLAVAGVGIGGQKKTERFLWHIWFSLLHSRALDETKLIFDCDY